MTASIQAALHHVIYAWVWFPATENMKSSEWPETPRNTKICNIWAFFVDQNGCQSYKSCNFEPPFDPLNCIPQGLFFTVQSPIVLVSLYKNMEAKCCIVSELQGLKFGQNGHRGSCYRQTTGQTDRWHGRVTCRVAPCKQQGATKKKETQQIGSRSGLRYQGPPVACCHKPVFPRKAHKHGLWLLESPVVPPMIQTAQFSVTNVANRNKPGNNIWYYSHICLPNFGDMFGHE